MEKPEKSTRLHRALSAALAISMLAIVLVMGVMTVAPNWKKLQHAFQRRSVFSAYLPEGEGFDRLELLTAQVRSLDGAINENIWHADELGQVNATLQYALGKRLVVTGSAQMVRLNGGYLYDLQEEQSMADAAEEILDLRESLPEGMPFLFVYEHPTVYDPAMLPAGYDVLDYGEEAADEVTGCLRGGGVPVIDSRDVLTQSGYPLDSFLMRTDQHWSSFAALVMTRPVAEWLRDEAGLPLDPELLDVDRFETETLERLFLGRYGQRVGVRNIAPDDIHLFWPDYPTEITRHTVRPTYETDAEGSFREAVIRWDRLERGEGGWNTSAYGDYGLSDITDRLTNANAPRARILIFKDSYSSPIASFLSLAASDVYAVDLRQTDRPALSFVEEFQPDAVIVAYSQQMMRDREYAFVNE